MSWSATISRQDYEALHAHLHPGDNDEHAAFLYAGEASTPEGSRLLVRQVVPVEASEFGPSDRGGYRQISSRAVARAALACEASGLRLIWAHSHPESRHHVGFSRPDLATHARAHPHLIDMTGGHAVTSLVFGTDSVAGEVWTADGSVSELRHLDIVGARIDRLTAQPGSPPDTPGRFSRQVLMFGTEGQRRLRTMTVAVVGAGGGGSLLVQSLAHLGVGRIVIVDFDRVEVSNLSRIVGATRKHARRAALKVEVLADLVANIDPEIEVVPVVGNVTFAEDARRLLIADYIFSATDTLFARFAVNAICHQYVIPGSQIGAKVVTSGVGDVDLAYSMHRPIHLDGPCLECGGAIDPEALRVEQLSPNERRDQAYIGSGSEASAISDPSVITLNSLSASLGMLDFQLSVTGGFSSDTRLQQRVYHAPDRDLRERPANTRPTCRWCHRGYPHSAFGRGDTLTLPLLAGASPGLRTIERRASRSRRGFFAGMLR